MVKKFVLLTLLVVASLFLFAACGDDDVYRPAAVERGEHDEGFQPGGTQPPAADPAPAPPATVYERAFLRFPAGHIVHDPIVYAVEINQSLSWGFDTQTGEFFLMDHFVAGKETAVFIQFTAPVEDVLAGGGTAFVSIYHYGNFVTQLDWIDIAAGDPHTLWFQPRAMADVGNWAAGEYTFIVYINGEVVAERTAQFHTSRTMRVLAVPIIANYGGEIRHPGDIWPGGLGMLHGTFPVAREDVQVTLGPAQDATDSMFDLWTAEGRWTLGMALMSLQTPTNCFDAIVAYIPDPVVTPEGSIILGWVVPGTIVAIASETDPEKMATVIHEIAHFYNIGDEYQGGAINLISNQPPYGMGGWNLVNQMGPDLVGYHPNVIGGAQVGWVGSGSVIHPAQRPFYVEGRKFLHNVTSYMGIANEFGTNTNPWYFWVTSDMWIHKFRTFTGAVGGTGTPAVQVGGQIVQQVGFTCLNCNMDMGSELYLFERCEFGEGFNPLGFVDPPADVTLIYAHCESCDHLTWYPDLRERNAPVHGTLGRAASPQSVMALEIRGSMGSDGTFEPRPWFVFEAESNMLHNQREGEFSVRFFDTGGELLSSAYFNLVFQATQRASGGEGEGSWFTAPEVNVDLLVRFPDATASIAIYRGDTEVHFVELTQNAPTVAFTGMYDYMALGNSVTLTWEAEGDAELFFEIWYNPADDLWFNIASDITGRSFTADLSDLPGTSEGFFYIFVTDGVRTDSAYSPWVSVPYKPPVIHTDLSTIHRFPITDEFILDVDIYDKQDGFLWWEGVTWTLEGRHFIDGSGLWIWPFELNPGYHTFSLEAVNSAGLSVYGELTVYVINDDSALPSDWSRDDIVKGLSQGFIVDLRRLDTPITRGRFATFMNNVYFDMYEGEWYDMDFPEYQEGAILDGGQDSYDFFVMVYLGMMEAPGGRFNPNGTVTEREAALIMYRMAALADPQWFWDDADDDQILGWLFEIGALEDDGPNAFRESEPLTNRLAMVRLARFYAAVFE